MATLQQQFITFLLEHQALRFGDFSLKSGRKSPYFFNLGVFHSGATLLKLATFYAEMFIQSRMPCDVLFGPAYKGIPLVAASSLVLFDKFNKNFSYCFNRKEAKDHGDGGEFVGAELQGNVVMLDDVITAGTTVRNTIQLLEKTSARLSGIVIAFDRQEYGLNSTLSAVQEAVKTHHVPVQSITTLSDLVQYLHGKKEYTTQLKEIERYRREYGV